MFFYIYNLKINIYMELFKNKYDFVRDELKDLPEFSELPKEIGRAHV